MQSRDRASVRGEDEELIATLVVVTTFLIPLLVYEAVSKFIARHRAFHIGYSFVSRHRGLFLLLLAMQIIWLNRKRAN